MGYSLYQSHYFVPLSCDLTVFLDSRVDICQIFHWFFEKFKRPKRHSEIN